VYAHLGAAGFFVLLIVGVSYRLVPMFLLGEVQSSRRALGSVFLLNLTALVVLGLCALLGLVLSWPRLPVNAFTGQLENLYGFLTLITMHQETTIGITPEIGPDRMLDVRETPCSIKHGLILRSFVELEVGGHFILRNGHDPVPLRYQFEAEFPGTFTWDYVHRQPEDVAVKITKHKTLGPLAGELPSACGGH
jgi:uncharacterized protein (DUF2249 family)